MCEDHKLYLNTGEKASLQSENYPSTYSRLSNCWLIISTSVCSRITLNFTFFRTEEPHDYLRVSFTKCFGSDFSYSITLTFPLQCFIAKLKLLLFLSVVRKTFPQSCYFVKKLRNVCKRLKSCFKLH